MNSTPQAPPRHFPGDIPGAKRRHTAVTSPSISQASTMMLAMSSSAQMISVGRLQGADNCVRW